MRNSSELMKIYVFQFQIIPYCQTPNSSNRFCTLFVYVSLDYENIARLLIENGSNVNAIMNDGRIPLHEAAWHGKLIDQMHFIEFN